MHVLALRGGSRAGGFGCGPPRAEAGGPARQP